MAATLTGHVTLQSQAATNLVVRFFTPNTDTEEHKAAVATDGAGDFTVTGIPAGTYDIGIKNMASLSLLQEDKVFTDGNTTDVTFGTLLLGDLIHGADEDYISLSDYNLLIANYDTAGPCWGYAGDWLLPCDIPVDDCGGGGVAGKGAAYKMIGGQPTVI